MPAKPAISRPSAIFFDLDETLIDNTRDFNHLLTDVFNRYFPHTVVNSTIEPLVSNAIRKSAALVWKEMFQCRGEGKQALTEIFLQALRQCELDESHSLAMGEHFARQASEGTRLKPGVIELLVALRTAGFSTGIITNGIELMQREKISRHGLDQQVDKVIVSEQAGAHKPDARVFEFALSELDVVAGQAWHIGDHPLNDVTGAINCGLTGILYAPTDNHLDNYTFENNAVSAPDHTLRSLLELVGLLKISG